jgi:hypothetical protein
MNPKIILCLALVLSGGLFGCSSLTSQRAMKQDFLLSFPNQLKSGEQVVGFELHVQNGKILTVNKVPYDWIINMCVQAPMSDMSAFPNHGASGFQDMIPLQRFVTIQSDRPNWDITGCLVLTKNFTDEWTNSLTKSDFVLKKITPHPQP